MKRSVILPTYNEAGSIERTIQAVTSEVAAWPDCEIVVSDNASTDQTVEIVRKLGLSDPRISVLTAERNGLYAWNVDRGIRASGADRIFVLDGDGQFPPAVLHELDEHLTAGSALVLGHRKIRVGGAVRLLASYTYLILCRLFLGFDLRDINAGARALSRPMADVVQIKHLGMMVNPELWATARSHGFVISEVSVGHEHRLEGGSSHVFSRPFALVGDAVKYFMFLRANYRPLGRPRLTRRR
ncbi:MAG: putative dolichol-phosphate mannosyltransferase-putative rane bound sugar transferase involved in [Microbacteriaceae bacterium]|nr:putative dolichol-phosphate mannosyltransferase-putative rane bound sugar transferase involved in [Microbacteriaceae bacterium]